MRHVRTLGVCLIAMCALGAGVAQSASANDIEELKNCPLANPLVRFCTQGHTYEGAGGFYTVGPFTVQILKSIVLQGGYYEEASGELAFVAPENGTQVIEPTPEVVPGNPLANVSEAEMEEAGWKKKLRKSYKKAQEANLFKEGETTEVIEAAGLPHLNTLDLVFEEQTAIKAPIKIVGKNPWLEKLGGNCEIGSTAEPVVQNLTTGTSTSPLTGETIRGSGGSLELIHEGEEAKLSGTVLVDNTYAVPAAHGCGGKHNEKFLDPIVDKAFGIPAQAGASTTQLVGQFTTMTASYARELGI